MDHKPMLVRIDVRIDVRSAAPGHDETQPVRGDFEPFSKWCGVRAPCAPGWPLGFGDQIVRILERRLVGLLWALIGPGEKRLCQRLKARLRAI